MTSPTPKDATLSEVFSPRAADAAAVGFVVAHLDTDKPVLWIQDRITRKETGRPYTPGLPRDLDLIYVDVTRPVDVLWAMEEGLRCRDFGAVLGELWGNPQALDFTATKRLALRAESYRVPAWLIRRAAEPTLSAARNRWRVSSLQSLQNPWDNRAPGTPVWEADLFRTRWGKPGRWVATYDNGTLQFSHGMEADAVPPAEQVRR
ncbi:hypothetical protein BVC71_03770 [Marivivens niveibacter]|uniref:Uncharacterized protein n=1 Tax=Marivivens niveibacter TaxID=1930667 RepID=A0A251X1L8_9RHOB|nr:hypothetical protein [Marivivens niveibacter]OUD10620.1 hypothetical protein BVC71_03770 [Marivivens niveibacter]